MKKLFASVLLLMLSAVSFAQILSKSLQVTEFMGIPVDGTKSEMIQKLQAKGFVYDSDENLLSGEINGNDVVVFISTSGDKVYRIMVADAKTTEDKTLIKTRFNELCRLFASNPRYVQCAEGDQTISEDTDIPYEISVNKKSFDASFYQKFNCSDDQLNSIYEQLDKALNEKSSEEIRAFADEVKIDKNALSLQQIKDTIKKMVVDEYVKEAQKMMPVWISIGYNHGEFSIMIFYENIFNNR